jgi:hypothetical protein
MDAGLLLLTCNNGLRRLMRVGRNDGGFAVEGRRDECRSREPPCRLKDARRVPETINLTPIIYERDAGCRVHDLIRS